MIKSSAPGAYHRIIKPVLKAITLDNEVNKLLDDWEEDGDKRKYDKAVFLAKKSNKLIGGESYCFPPHLH